MLRRKITYTNPFTNEEVTEEHYFHISKAQLLEMEVEEHKDRYTPKSGGDELTGMQAKLQRIVDSEDGKAIMTEFKDILRRAYGKKDGDRFIRSPEIWADFASSEAYSQLLFEMLTKADSAAEFIAGVIPGNLEQIAAEVRAQAEKEEKAEATGERAVVPAEEAQAVIAQQQPAEDRQLGIKAATPENPALLTRADIQEMEDADLRSGLAEGRYKLS